MEEESENIPSLGVQCTNYSKQGKTNLCGSTCVGVAGDPSGQTSGNVLLKWE